MVCFSNLLQHLGKTQESKMILLTVTDIFTEIVMDSLCENKPITSSSISFVFFISPSSSSAISYQRHSLLSGSVARFPSLRPCFFTSPLLPLTPQPPEGPLPPSTHAVPSRRLTRPALIDCPPLPLSPIFPSFLPTAALLFLPTSSLHHPSIHHAE